MQNLGERLEEARKRKGVSVREAAEATKVRSDYLQKFEANSFEIDLPPLYIRGFVRNYARYLDIDAERFLAEFDSMTAAAGRTPRRESREVYGRVEFAEGGEGATPTRSKTDPALMMKYSLFGGGALLLVVLIILVVYAFSSHSSPKSTSTLSQSGTVPTAMQSVDAAQTLTFTALDNTRLKIVQESNNAIIFNSALNRGETKSFGKTGSLRITVEDRTRLRMEINGRATEIPQFVNGNYGQFRLE
jgi:cytoskeleton protein RodZ